MSTEAARRLLDVHGHRRVVVVEPGDVAEWCEADDEEWPCPFAVALKAIETEAEERDRDRFRMAILALPWGDPSNDADAVPIAARAAVLGTIDGAEAATDDLEGYWERAYWHVVPKLQAALSAISIDASDIALFHGHHPNCPYTIEGDLDACRCGAAPSEIQP